MDKTIITVLRIVNETWFVLFLAATCTTTIIITCCCRKLTYTA